MTSRTKSKATEFLKEFIGSGYQIDSDVLELLMSKEQPKSLIKQIIATANKLPKSPLVITKEFLNSIEPSINGKKRSIGTDIFKKDFEIAAPVIKRDYKLKNIPEMNLIDAKEVEAEITIIKSPNATKSTSTTPIENLAKLFQSRYNKLKKLLLERTDTRNSVPIAKLHSSDDWEDFYVIGMLNSKREAKTGGYFLEIEDPTGIIQVIVSSKEEDLVRKAERLLEDQVLCIHGAMQKKVFLVKEILLPEIPTTYKSREASIPICAALISDLHVGSVKFLDDVFEQFILWLKGEVGGEKERKLGRSVKYLLIAGDLVEGIGIFPNQKKELRIKDIYQQYEEVGKLLEQVPEHIEIIVIPGNHDATRQALPQTPIPKEFAEKLYEMPNVQVLGSPTYISIHDVTVLMDHGRSLDDVVESIPTVQTENPDSAMVELLRARHLSPRWGGKTTLAHEPNDFLVIEEIPDIFHAGHTHTNGVTVYRGVTVVNSGAFQAQTNYQKRININPTPGIVPVMNLKTRKITEINFN
ncbi:MAG: DNA-directed DNA polymerase II small subunit [Promethearchaeota archaeon]